MSIAALAREAEVNRTRLIDGSLKDLGARFASLADARSQPTTAREVELDAELAKVRARLDDLTDKHQRLVLDRDRWRTLAEGLIRSLNVKTREVDNLERRLSQQPPPDTSGPHLRRV